MADELGGKTILLVDDDREILNAMASALGDLGATIHTAVDGAEAVSKAEEHNPDLIVLDQMLPKRSGFLVMERLKRTSKPGEAPRVVMITANPGHRHKSYAQSLGVDVYINKPFRMERLLAAVQKLLGDGE
jgi:DNA-binding response OmpR family regulator